MANTVIVFGPTGNIGAYAARAAHDNGAKVVLAMRDTSKAISGLTADQEKAGNYTRVQADLLQPETVAAAVKQTGARRAFFYVAHGSGDHMRATIQALKDSGVTLPVLLSSYTVPDDDALDAVPADEVIGFAHAQVELSLVKVYGKDNYVALRPGAFATNSLRWLRGIKAGQLPLYGSTFAMDCITPGDMGRVAGSILAHGPREGESIIYLYGPRERPQADMAAAIGKTIGKDITVAPQSADQFTQMMQAAGVAGPVIDWMVKRLSDDPSAALPKPRHAQGRANIEKYTGKAPEEFETWAKDNAAVFA